MQILTKIVGVSFAGRQETVKELEEGQVLYWVKDHGNAYDVNAVELFVDPELRKSVGHLSRKIAEKVRFAQFVVRVAKVTGKGEEKKNLGVNIVVEIVMNG